MLKTDLTVEISVKNMKVVIVYYMNDSVSAGRTAHAYIKQFIRYKTAYFKLKLKLRYLCIFKELA